MSALRNTAAALALGLTGGLALPGGAFADCDAGLAGLKESYGSNRVDVVLGALSSVTRDESCSSGRIVGAKRQAASVVARYASAKMGEGRVDEAEAIILQAPALHWAVQAVRGDIAAKRGNREDAAGFYNSALDLLADPRLTKQSKQLAPIAQRLAGLAQENMMLAGTTESALPRGDTPSGVLRFVARGLAVEKAGSGGADVYKPDDYQEPDKIAVYQPPKKDEDEYKAPKKDDEVVYNPPAKVEVYVVDEQKDDTYKPPKKDDYAVIDDTYKAIGDVFLPIRFATNSDHLDHAGFKEAERLADFLIKQKVPSIIIEGHTDDVGKASYNLDLSERRARTLANFLKSLGVHTHIRIIGKGEHEPPHLTNAAIYSLDEQRTIARRVEVSFGY